MNYYRRFFLRLLLLCIWTPLDATVIQSSTTISTHSFDFTLGAYTYAAYSGVLYTGAQTALADNNFAVALARRTGNFFTPLAPATVTLNNEKNQPNPLYGAGISLLASWGDRPLLVTTASQNALYFYDGVGVDKDIVKLDLISLEKIQDALQAPATSIALATDTQRSFAFDSATRTVAALKPTNAFVAVKPQAGAVGDPGTGVALVTYTEAVLERDIETEVENADKTKTKVVTKQAAIPAKITVAPTVPLDGTSAAVKINGDATLTGINDLYWDPLLKKLFIALSVSSGLAAGDGARSVVLGVLQNGKLTFMPIAPDSAFAGTTTLVGTGNSATGSEVLKVRTMHTSTRLIYMLIVKDNSVYALPLVHDPKSADNGTLAALSGIPTNVFLDIFPYPFLDRKLPQPATTPADMATISTPAARVGGTGSFPGIVSEIQVSTDAVFVSTTDVSSGMPAGTFRSQAVFSSNGLIVSWTNWERIGGTVGNLTGFAYDPFAVSFWTLSQTSGTSTVTRSDWSDYSLEDTFAQKEGGVQTLATFTPAGISLIAIGGNNILTLTQTGDTTGPITPITLKYVLPDIGAVTSIEIVTDTHQSWLVVGGSTGVAFLSDQYGNGWQGDLISGLAQLSPLSWRKIGQYSNVRKLASDTGTLFILTDTLLDSLLVTPTALIQYNEKTIKRLATTQAVPGNPLTFSDLIVTEASLFLATTVGLMQSLRDAPTDMRVWSLIKLHESPGPVSALYAVTGGGMTNLYALATSQTLHQSRIYRLAIGSNNKVVPFEDYFIKNFPTFFINIGSFRNYMTNNGALFEFSRSRYLAQPVILEKLPPDFRFGVYEAAQRATSLAPLPVTANTIRRVAYDPATGSLLAYGDFGIKINR